MNTFRVLIMVAILSARSMSLAAGADSSGGGGAFLCDNGTTAELIDLVEASLPGRDYNVVYSNSPIDEQIKKAIAKLDLLSGDLALKVSHSLWIVQKDWRKIDRSKFKLAPPPDGQLPYIKEGCEAVGMMLWDGDLRRTVVDEEIYNKLKTNTDKAAAWIHEAVFHALRSNKEYAKMMDRIASRWDFNGSTQARKITACLFSDNCPKAGTIAEQLKVYTKYSDVAECETSSNMKNTVVHKFFYIEQITDFKNNTPRPLPVHVNSEWNCCGVGGLLILTGEKTNRAHNSLDGYGYGKYVVASADKPFSHQGPAYGDINYFEESIITEFIPGFEYAPITPYQKQLPTSHGFLTWFKKIQKVYQSTGFASDTVQDGSLDYTLTCKRYTSP